MALKYANLCKVCHEHKTLNPSGICSKCRRLKGSTVCTLCGKLTTTHPSGLCYKCRRKITETKKIDANSVLDTAISSTEKTLKILKLRKENMSFSNIAKQVGLSKSATYDRFMKTCNLYASTTNNSGYDAADGTFIDEEGADQDQDMDISTEVIRSIKAKDAAVAE